MKTNWLVCFSELYRNEKTRVRESHQPNYRYAGLTHCQMGKRKLTEKKQMADKVQ